MKRILTTGQGQPNRVIWGEIHSRLESAKLALEKGQAYSEEEKKRILRDRARVLAREPQHEETVTERLEILEFLLAYEKYGVETAYVREVYPLREFTPLPCTPPFVLGIINVRGQILSVIDIKKFFDLPEKGLTDLNKVIILRDDKMEFGILADVVLGVRSVPMSEIQPPLPTLTGIREEYLKGVTTGRLVVLDALKILSAENLIVHEEIGT